MRLKELPQTAEQASTPAGIKGRRRLALQLLFLFQM